MEIKKIMLDNFMGVKHLEVDFCNRTYIKGANEAGKTTIAHAFSWVMFNKTFDGNTPSKIRPHDGNGIDIDMIEISASVLLVVDGKKIEFKKAQNQKWTKPHGSQEKRFDGNVNTYEIDGFPSKEKDYKEKIASIINEDIFASCTNASSFFKLDTKKKRAKLCSLASDLTDNDVIQTNSEFSVFADKLTEHTADEWLDRYTVMLNGKGNGDKGLKGQLKDIPARVDELTKQKVDVDTAELELEKNGIKSQIAEIDAKLSDLSQAYSDKEDSLNKALKLKFDISAYVNKKNAELAEGKNKLRGRISNYESDLKLYESKNSSIKESIRDYKNRISEKADEKKKLGTKYKSYKAASFDKSKWKFDENSTICPNCGQEYPKDKVEQIRSEFDSKKKAAVKEFEVKKKSLMQETIDSGNLCNDKIKEYKEEIGKSEKQLSELVKPSTNVEKLQKELSALPTDIDFEKDPIYLKMYSEVEELEKISKSDTAENIREELNFKKEALQSQLITIEKKISSVDINTSIDSRIDELSTEKKELAQKISEIEGIIDVLKRFNKTKCEMISEIVNKSFSLVQWKLFEPQINGGYKDVCIPMVDGSDYGNGLNHGNMLLVELDICLTMQKINNVNVPIFLDDSESIDDWRIPKIESQLIVLRRTDDKYLTVETMEVEANE